MEYSSSRREARSTRHAFQPPGDTSTLQECQWGPYTHAIHIPRAIAPWGASLNALYDFTTNFLMSCVKKKLHFKNTPLTVRASHTRRAFWISGSQVCDSYKETSNRDATYVLQLCKQFRRSNKEGVLCVKVGGHRRKL